jgi:hypothetical protein
MKKQSKKAAKEKASKGITKKSVIIDILNAGGATVDQMAKAIVKAKLGGDLDLNKRVTRLWLRKIGFKVEKDKNSGVWKKAD